MLKIERNMMLRSSSTPVLGSLLSSYFENPIHHHYSEINPSKQRYSPISFHHQHHQNYNKKLGSVLMINACQSPLSPSRSNGFRRVQSEGNLEGLLASSSSFDGADEFDSLVQPKKLQIIPSFSFHNSLHLSEDEEADKERDDGLEEEGEQRAKAILDNVNFGLGKSYSYVYQVANLPCQEESEKVVSKMHIATGLGVNDFSGSIGGSYGGGGGSKDKRRGSSGDDGGGANKIEEYYKKMMEENPGNPLFMRNYAEFLHQIKNDLRGSEEYYSRAILADPTDGESLSQYAKVIWELHHDYHKAASYFERAVQAAPQDSVVHAAHACFLWETEEEDEIEGGAPEEDLNKVGPPLCEDPVAAAKA